MTIPLRSRSDRRGHQFHGHCSGQSVRPSTLLRSGWCPMSDTDSIVRGAVVQRLRSRSLGTDRVRLRWPPCVSKPYVAPCCPMADRRHPLFLSRLPLFAQCERGLVPLCPLFAVVSPFCARRDPLSARRNPLSAFLEPLMAQDGQGTTLRFPLLARRREGTAQWNPLLEWLSRTFRGGSAASSRIVRVKPERFSDAKQVVAGAGIASRQTRSDPALSDSTVADSARLTSSHGLCSGALLCATASLW